VIILEMLMAIAFTVGTHLRRLPIDRQSGIDEQFDLEFVGADRK